MPINELVEEEVSLYTVKQGDTLYQIAKKFNVSIDKIKKLNNLYNNTLSIGQKLILSEPTNSNNKYVVQNGDTLYGIANKFGVNINTLKNLNKLTSDTLSIGQEILIPNINNSLDSKVVYTIKKGDNLWNLAKTYNTTVEEIKKLNNLSNEFLSIGQTIILPNK